MDLTYPFSTAFSLANKREACVESAQVIYRCLLLSQPESMELHFEMLTALGTRTVDKTLDKVMVKELVRVFFWPDHKGRLSMVQSVDRKQGGSAIATCLHPQLSANRQGLRSPYQCWVLFCLRLLCIGRYEYSPSRISYCCLCRVLLLRLPLQLAAQVQIL
jgi:hypothetical protein